MKNGELVGSAAYGYVLKNGTLVINEEEAEVIRTIFRLYLSGMGKPKIADYLNENNIPYHGSVENWSLNTIDYILQNERYIGDALLQKTFTSDRLPFKRHRNKGNCPMYYVSFSHPPIISREDFEAVKELQRKRQTTITRTHRKLSKLLVCNDCNHSYRRIEINGKNYWKCPCRSRGERSCDSILLDEEDVCAALIRMVNILHQDYDYIIKPAIAAKEHLLSKENGVDHKVYEIDSRSRRDELRIIVEERIIRNIINRGIVGRFILRLYAIGFRHSLAGVGRCAGVIPESARLIALRCGRLVLLDADTAGQCRQNHAAKHSESDGSF